MMDDEQATIESQFFAYAKLFESKTRTGETITLYHSDYWMRQAGLLDDRKLTMTDTGLFFNKFSKSEINLSEWLTFVSELCARKQLQEERVLELLTNCGLPEFAYRRCSADGAWAGRHPNDSSPNGWTNYTPCFPPLVQSLFDKVYDDEGDAQTKFQIAANTRYLEIIGYSTSYVALIISLVIFNYFSSLQNRRTLIHRNLFTAILLEITIRLGLYIDQIFGISVNLNTNIGVSDYDNFKFDNSNYEYSNSSSFGLNVVPSLCETSYILLEYAISVMFTWMLIEGVFLNNLVSNKSLRFDSYTSYTTYIAVGWILPVFQTLVWAVTTGYHYYNETVNLCWYGYNFHWFYWIAQGPRCIVIFANLLFLLNIMRVLMMKLGQSTNSERVKLMKAARAALILLPLLGMTNAFSLIEPPLDSSVAVFATWCYATHFFRSFQGLLIATIYCFLNAEVQAAIKKCYNNYRLMREYRRRYINTIAALSIRDQLAMEEEIPMQSLAIAGTSTTNYPNVSEIPDIDEYDENCKRLCCVDRTPPPRRTRAVVHFADPPLTEERCIEEYESPAGPSTPEPSPRRYPVTPPPHRVRLDQRPRVLPQLSPD